MILIYYFLFVLFVLELIGLGRPAAKADLSKARESLQKDSLGQLMLDWADWYRNRKHRLTPR